MPKDGEPIGFLLSVANRRKGLAFRTELSAFNLTPRQYSVLARLWEEDGLPLHELAKRLYADQTSLSRTLYTMERAGWIRRTRDREDRRVCRFFLADKGRDLQKLLLPFVQRLNEAMLADFCTSEVHALRSMLKKMIANMQAVSTDETSQP